MKLFFNILILFIVNILQLLAQSTFSEQTIRSAINTYLKDNIAQSSDYEIISKIEPIKYSQSGVTASIINNDGIFSGIINLQIVFKADNIKLKILNISVRIIDFIEMPFATKNIYRNSIISSDDIEYKLIDKNKYESNDIINLNIIGKKSTKYIQKGSLIQSNMIESDKIINRGDKVIIYSNSGAISVKAQGIALEDGSEGQPIRISIEASNKRILYGIVQADGSVLIH